MLRSSGTATTKAARRIKKMARTSKNKAESRRAEAENGGVAEEYRPITCFDHGLKCWVCDGYEECEYCQWVAGKLPELQLEFEL